MSLACCGTCGHEIGISHRCEHHPAPVMVPVLPEPENGDWLEELLVECGIDENAPELDVEEFSDKDFNFGIPRWVLDESMIDERSSVAP